MGIESKITSKGQTTIPIAVREKLGLHPGDKIAFIETGRGYLIVPRNRPASSLFGILSSYAIPGATIEDYDKAIEEYFAEHEDGGE